MDGGGERPVREEGGRLLLWRPFHCVWTAFSLPFFFFFFPVALCFLWHFKSISLMSRTAIVPIVNIHRDISLLPRSPRAWRLCCAGSYGDSHHVLLPEHPAVASSRLGSGSSDYKQKICSGVVRISLKNEPSSALMRKNSAASASAGKQICKRWRQSHTFSIPDWPLKRL